MNRRAFIAGLGGAAVVGPRGAWGQPNAVVVAGFLSPIAVDNAALFLDAYRQGLKATGFVEGQNLKVEYRWADGNYERLPILAADLVKLRVGVITTMGNGAYAARAAQNVGSREPIPIVFALGDDPVATGLVASLNRPGGHITGGTSFGHALGPKKLELLHQLVPTGRTFALLVNPKQSAEMETQEILKSAAAMALKIDVLKASNPNEIEEAFATIVRERIDGLIVTVDTFLFAESNRLGALAARLMVPTIGSLRTFAVAGGLASFNGNVTDVMYNVAVYTGRVLKGEKPADLPVQLPTKFDLALNLKAATALGLTVPLPLLGRADEVIE